MRKRGKIKVGISGLLNAAIGCPDERMRLFSNSGVRRQDMWVYSYRDNVSFSLKELEKKKLKPFVQNIAVHLFMVINPLPGYEFSIANNKSDIVNSWAKPAIMMLRRYKRTLRDISLSLYPEDELDIVGELKANHGYKAISAPEGYINQIYDYFFAEFDYYTVARKSSMENQVLYTTVDRVVQLVRTNPLQRKVIVS